MQRSLYERIGGEAAIMAGVTLFYKKVLADPLTAPFFRSLDMPAQTMKQMAFMAWAFGGPEEYKGRSLREAHAGLVSERGLTDEHFDRIAKLLRETLNELELPKPLVDEALETIAGTREEVLGR